MQEHTWAPKQLEAINTSLDITHRIVCITGAAGTGKSAILRAIYKRFVNAGYKIIVVAPTGKAAKRIQELTGIEAQTIHAALEYSSPGDPDPITGKTLYDSVPRRNRLNPLDADVVLADEYAMVTHEVHRALVDALPPKGLLRVVGDINQLKPIEESRALAGKPTAFMRLMEGFPTIVLDVIHRQTAQSSLLDNCQRILAGRFPQRSDDFRLCITDKPVDAVLDLCAGTNAIADFGSPNAQVITVQHKSWVGTGKLNAQLQRLLCPLRGQTYLEVPRHTWMIEQGCMSMRAAVGDKVICTKNDYALRVFNGEGGIITDISSYGEITVDLGDRVVVFPPSIEAEGRRGVVEYDPRKNLDLAYALTTHKCQGSEYGTVVYVLSKVARFMQSRRNFYTAVSRARERVVIVADQQSLNTSLMKVT